MSKNNEITPVENQLLSKVSELIELARKQVAVTVNLTMVHTYYEIGRMIVEDEQKGKERAEYGKTVLKDLSVKLIEKFGKGFSLSNLKNMRQFFLVFGDRELAIRWKASGELLTQEIKAGSIRQKVSSNSPKFTLSWSHYLILMRIKNPMERSFYE
jgi:predicted nuclease of restriction endonuclease-like (RecB) superfamily